MSVICPKCKKVRVLIGGLLNTTIPPISALCNDCYPEAEEKEKPDIGPGCTECGEYCFDTCEEMRINNGEICGKCKKDVYSNDGCDCFD